MSQDRPLRTGPRPLLALSRSRGQGSLAAAASALAAVPRLGILLTYDTLTICRNRSIPSCAPQRCGALRGPFRYGDEKFYDVRYLILLGNMGTCVLSRANCCGCEEIILEI